MIDLVHIVAAFSFVGSLALLALRFGPLAPLGIVLFVAALLVATKP